MMPTTHPSLHAARGIGARMGAGWRGLAGRAVPASAGLPGDGDSGVGLGLVVVDAGNPSGRRAHAAMSLRAPQPAHP